MLDKLRPGDFEPPRKEPIAMKPGQVSRAVVTAHLRKFNGRSGAPPERPGQLALIEMFQRQCSSENHLERVVDRLLETVKYYPTPANVAEAAEYIAQAARFQQTSPRRMKCSACGDTGWKTIAGNGMQDYAEKCDCPKDKQITASNDHEAADLSREMYLKYKTVAERETTKPSEKAKQSLALAWIADYEAKRANG